MERVGVLLFGFTVFVVRSVLLMNIPVIILAIYKYMFMCDEFPYFRISSTPYHIGLPKYRHVMSALFL